MGDGRSIERGEGGVIEGEGKGREDVIESEVYY
jgi:hypothetical protein